jgi:tetratricopeptide (TPR) repeat protein
MIGLVRLVLRLIRTLFAVARWAEERIKEWYEERQFQQREGQRHLAARNYSEAEKHLQLALDERRHSKQKRCELLLNLERAQRRQGKFTEAEQSLQAAMAVASSRALRVRAEDALLDLHLEQARHPEAEQAIADILRAEQAEARPDGARVTKCYRKLGALRLKTARHAEAMEAYRHAAEMSERVFGEHTETAESFGELGALLRQHGDHAEAQRYLRRALDIHRAASGLDSREATQGLYHLAASLEESGDLDGAAAEYERLLGLRARQVGVNPLENAEAQVRLAGLYITAGRIGPAKELLNSALAVLERNGGQPLAQALDLLALAEEQSGRPDEARRWREVASSLAVGATSSFLRV